MNIEDKCRCIDVLNKMSRPVSGYVPVRKEAKIYEALNAAGGFDENGRLTKIGETLRKHFISECYGRSSEAIQELGRW